MTRTLFLLGLIGMSAACLGQEMPGSGLNCANCHALNTKVVGPSWMEISQRYQSRREDPALLEQLVKNVSHGSQGAWGNLPMPPADPGGAKRAQIVEMVKHILSLSGQAPKAKGK